MSDKKGFKIEGTFYPYIASDEWAMEDYLLARELTRVEPLELLSPKGDALILTIALEAVAIRHGKPELSTDEIIAYVKALKPADVDQVGFEPSKGDARPPDEKSGQADQT